jgi:pimeloyl-ACP methyl ester carboxylesterase
LPHKVFTTLRLLVESTGRLLTRQQLLSAVWPDVAVEEGNLNHVISVPRKPWVNRLTGSPTSKRCRANRSLRRDQRAPIASCVPVPTVVFHSDRDEVIPIEEGRMLAAEIPNAIFVPLPTANHLLLQEEPARGKFREELAAFLHW